MNSRYRDLTNIGAQSFVKSKILSDHDYEYISGWIPSTYKNMKMKTIYSSSKHAKTVAEITSKLKGVKGSILLYQTSTGVKCGGFCDKDWTEQDKYFSSPNAFLFNLTAGKKFVSKTGEGVCLYEPKGKYGPSFGTELRLDITNMSGSASVKLYDCPSNKILCGGGNWKCQEFEIIAFE